MAQIWMAEFYVFLPGSEALTLIYSSFERSCVHGQIKMEWMAVPTISFLIPMHCGKIKPFVKATPAQLIVCHNKKVVYLKSSAVETVLGTLGSLKFWWFIQQKCSDVNSAMVFEQVSRDGALSFKSANSSIRLLTIKGNKYKQITLLYLLLRQPLWQTGEWGFTHAKKLFRCRGNDCTCPTFYAASPLLLLR